MNKTFEFTLQYYQRSKTTKMLAFMAVFVLIIAFVLINAVYHSTPFIEQWKSVFNICLLLLGGLCGYTWFINHQREKQLFLLLYTLFIPVKQKLMDQYKKEDIWKTINLCNKISSSPKAANGEIQESISQQLQDYTLIETNAEGTPIRVQYQLLYLLIEQDIPPSELPEISNQNNGNRQFKRYKTGMPTMVLIKHKNGNVLKGNIIDISRGGVCVHCEKTVDVEEVLLLEIYSTKNYYFFHTDQLLFTCMGTVVRSWEDQTSGFAIIFDDIIDFSMFTKKFILSTPYLIK